ncbi:MAG: hypothetical protein Q9209_007575 [Squamulea sp. 1 TL-2023]
MATSAPTTGASVQRPTRRRLPIIPAIPRKLEKQLRKTPNLAAGHPECIQILETLPVSGDGGPHKEPDTQFSQQLDEIKVSRVEESSAKDNTGSNDTAMEEYNPMTATTPPVADSSPLSVLDPETPPFIPDTSKAPSRTPEDTSSLDGKPSDPQAPYPTRTITTESWAPFQTTPPDSSIYPPTQRMYPAYGSPVPLFYAPAVCHPDKYANPSMYDGYNSSSKLSYYPQTSRSYVSASPVQSTYEGYAMANNPQAIHSRAISSSLPHTAVPLEIPQGSSSYTTSQLQPHHPRPFPQFGNHFPITPSATPSNSGSQKQGSSPTNDAGQAISPDQTLKVDDGHNEAPACRTTGQEYQGWCNQIMETLNQGKESLGISQSLSNHIIANFNNPTFADCELYISHVSRRFEPSVVSLHSLLIAQNSKLQALLQNADMREDGKKQILLDVKDEHVDPAALQSAIRICYGEQPSLYTGYPNELTSGVELSLSEVEVSLISEVEVSKAWMHNALAFAAAGHLLDMIGVAHRGEQIASMILNWDNLEQALSFASDTRIKRAWGSSSDLSSFPCNASELLLSCLYFIISNVTESTLSSFTTKPNSLSRIQFGDLPVESREPNSKVSAILSSMPSDHVKFILDRVPPVTKKSN